MKLQSYGNRLYRQLPGEVDCAIDHRASGSIRLASRERMEEFRHVVGMANAHGLVDPPVGEPDARAPPVPRDPRPARRLVDPDDGDIDPSQVTQALATGARAAGAEIWRRTKVTSIARTAAGEWRIGTGAGAITCEIVVNAAAGYRAREVGRMVGLDLPVVSMEHQYLVTRGDPERSRRTADRCRSCATRTSPGTCAKRAGLLLGPYEWDCRLAWDEELAHRVGMELFADDLDRLERYIEDAVARVPVFGTAGVTRVVNRRIPYTPDGNPLIGPAYGVANFYLCCAFSFGIVQAGGAGKAMASGLRRAPPEWDLWSLDPRRYTSTPNRRTAAPGHASCTRTKYAIAFPFEERRAGRRPTTPLYETLRAKCAMFGARGGWERAAWFVPAGRLPSSALASIAPTGSRRWARSVGRCASGSVSSTLRSSPSSRSAAKVPPPTWTG